MAAPIGSPAWGQAPGQGAPTPRASTPAAGAPAQQAIVDGARKTLGDRRHGKAFGKAARRIRQARAVMIVPKLLKGGFIVGGEGGEGVLLARERGGWSDPAFYSIGAASLGLQAGVQQSVMIL